MLWILIGIATAAAIGYYFLKKPHKYWTNLGVKQGNPIFLIGDNWKTLLQKQSLAEMVENAYNMCPGPRYSGLYQFLNPILVVKDPELIKQITVKDFEHFTDHRSFISENSTDLLSKNLFSLKGQIWRDTRATVSPTFTGSKMRQMFTLMTEVAENFNEYFKKQNAQTVIEMEFKDLFCRFANDVIATTAFGIQVDSLNERNNEFYLMGKEAIDFTGFFRQLKFLLLLTLPNFFKRLKINLLGKPINDFFLRVIKETIRIREEQNIVRPDVIHILLEARKGNIKQEDYNEVDNSTLFHQSEQIDKSKTKIDITDFEIAAHSLIFFFAGFDGVSSLICFTAYELAINPDIQHRLRQEINETSKNCPNNKINYESLIKMKYLDMVLSETVRKWPNGILMDRVCTKPYTIEPTSPEEVPIHLEEGAVVWIPLFGIHRDPQYYPNPERYDPERFNDENIKNIKPYTYMPFGAGPRFCIGQRFAVLETKVILAYLLKEFEIVPTKKTQIPLKISKKSMNLMSEDGFHLGLKPLYQNN